MLAGGLTPENVGEAIAATRPIGVDVSSGVESFGIRDEAKIRRFVEEAKSAFSKVAQSQPV
jgi:phosphoribosylanthranilate isomerase